MYKQGKVLGWLILLGITGVLLIALGVMNPAGALAGIAIMWGIFVAWCICRFAVWLIERKPTDMCSKGRDHDSAI
jgi:hypothetical protein